MKIQDFIIDENTSIANAIKAMDKNGKGIVFVCQNRVLKGVVSDGDFRRYILHNGNIQNEVKEITNYNPKILSLEKQSDAVQFMKENHITAVPIIDNKKRIIKIYFLDGEVVYQHIESEVPVVIMAGGKGTRLRPYTNVLPKPLIPIGEKTITEHIIERFENVGCNHFYMIVNYKKNLIKSFFQESGKKIDIIEEMEYLGTGGGLKLLEGRITETFFMTNCDVLLDEDYNEMLSYHKKSRNILTMVCAMKNEVLEYGTVDTKEDGQVVELKEKPSFSFLINTGLYIIEPEFLESIPETKFIHITDLIQECINRGERVGVYKVREDSWFDMGKLEALNQMKNRLDIY